MDGDEFSPSLESPAAGAQHVFKTGTGGAGGLAHALGAKAGGAVAQQVNAWQAYQDRRDQRIAELQAPGGAAEETASVCIGGIGDGRAGVLGGASTGARTTVRNSGDKKGAGGPTNAPKVINWEELARENKKVKVASEEDPDVFIWVNVAQQSIIRTNDGMLKLQWCKDKDKGGGP